MEYEKWLQKLGLSLKKGVKVISYGPLDELLNEKVVHDAIWKCLQKDYPDGVMELIAIYLEALEMDAKRRDAAMPGSTSYHSLKAKNPTIRTLAKLVSLVHERPR